MRKVLNKIAEIEIILSGFLFFVIFAINVLEIISRSVFNHSFLWVSDLAVICVAWMICLGMSACVHYQEHLFMEILAAKLPPGLRHALNIVISLIVFLFFVMLCYTGVQNACTKKALIFPSTQWSLAWSYSALPVFAFLSAIFMIRHLICLFKGVYHADIRQRV